MRGPHAIQFWHLNVHQDDVGFRVGGVSHGFTAILGLADHAQVGFGFEQGFHALPKQGVVVGEQNADHGSCIRRESARSLSFAHGQTKWSAWSWWPKA